MRYLYIILLGMLCLCFDSCVIATHKTIDHSIAFNKNSTFALAEDQDDKIGTVRTLKTLLINSGLNYASLQNAQNAVKNRTPLKESDINKDIEKAFNIKDINSIYSIALSYHYFKNLEGYSYKYFYYTIYDLNSGKKILWGSINHSGMDDNYLTILKALTKKIKSKIPSDK
ncbi:hypothetical protein NAT51_03435 [Flavobacterium amniphilum]|uniref:hypothetical protein n=1 Tax=Flavobacterium amniphilum TaxID=1834035 RepID=UPI00202A508F|nr:hypothetical protein [Flavobacterium amniphilum]MCL9804558.1 hypothetical protein [Flavobacterium amniphilum]